MQVQLSGQNIDITQALRDHVQSKLDVLTRHFDHITSLKVVLRVEKLQHQAEGTLAGSGCMLHANAADSDMYASIDTMIQKLDTQLLKHKEKLTSHHREEAREARFG